MHVTMTEDQFKRRPDTYAENETKTERVYLENRSVVWVVGIPFAYDRVSIAKMDGNDGQVDFATGTIQVADHVPEAQVVEVFSHEYLEAANKILDLGLDHPTICRLDVVFVNLLHEAMRLRLM